MQLSAAAALYPAEPRFRRAPAMQLFNAAKRFPVLIQPAIAALTEALQVDPNSIELVSALYGAKRAVGDCADAQALRERILMLAPGSEKAKSLAATGCSAGSKE